MSRASASSDRKPGQADSGLEPSTGGNHAKIMLNKAESTALGELVAAFLPLQAGLLFELHILV